jgi:hypothetical protein
MGKGTIEVRPPHGLAFTPALPYIFFCVTIYCKVNQNPYSTRNEAQRHLLADMISGWKERSREWFARSVTITVLGIAGSLRTDSYNRNLLAIAQKVAPADMEIRIHDLHEIPLFNADVEAKGDLQGVVAFKAAIRWADTLLIATPEYQHSIPGVLKNALDWRSRPPGKSPLQGKPVAILGTTGKFGTAHPGRPATGARLSSDAGRDAARGADCRRQGKV